MVIRNSVILIDQIETEIANGQHPWDAVIGATEHRLRPILLTAAAAILGMIPIAPTVFWGPMAYAVMGGLVVATLLTLVFRPRSTWPGFASSLRRWCTSQRSGNGDQPPPARALAATDIAASTTWLERSGHRTIAGFQPVRPVRSPQAIQGVSGKTSR
jgi:hypothetical protein